MTARGWTELDIILISGDAYVDHPSYGAAVIGRVLESAGYRVGIIAQPDWKSTKDFMRFGMPKLFFGITSGNVDSMVANYTASKKPRRTDDYSPGGKNIHRPDRALIVYSNRIKEAFKNAVIILGGIEASLRRLSHYDYWSESVRRSILLDAKADMLVYGMGENQIVEIADNLKNKKSISELNGIRGTVVARKSVDDLGNVLITPSHEEIKSSRQKFNEAFKMMYENMNPYSAKILAEPNQDRFVVQFPPALPLSTENLDKIYDLPYTRTWHPVYERDGGIKGLETVKASIISHRGCAGECAFCSLYAHQGRIVQSRSEESILKEAKKIAQDKNFKGTITDVGGPTSNLYSACCDKWDKGDFCANRKCLVPERCRNLRLGYKKALDLYKKIKDIPGVNHVFIGSGFRYDLLAENCDEEYLFAVCRDNISGQMKVAPEHVHDKVLELMNKPRAHKYEKFLKKLQKINSKLSQKVFLVNYFISAHPGAGMEEARELAKYLRLRRMKPEQVQDYMPLPMTLSGAMFYTGAHPFTGEKVFIARSDADRKAQRGLIPSGQRFRSG